MSKGAVFIWARPYPPAACSPHTTAPPPAPPRRRETDRNTKHNVCVRSPRRCCAVVTAVSLEAMAVIHAFLHVVLRYEKRKTAFFYWKWYLYTWPNFFFETNKWRIIESWKTYGYCLHLIFFLYAIYSTISIMIRPEHSYLRWKKKHQVHQWQSAAWLMLDS